MQLLYFITTVTSQVHSARHHQRAGYSALPSVYFLFCLPLLSILFLKTKRNDLARPVIGTIFLVYYLQEPTDIPSRKKLMRLVCARVGMSEEGVYCKIIFL